MIYNNFGFKEIIQRLIKNDWTLFWPFKLLVLWSIELFLTMMLLMLLFLSVLFPLPLTTSAILELLLSLSPWICSSDLFFESFLLFSSEFPLFLLLPPCFWIYCCCIENSLSSLKKSHFSYSSGCLLWKYFSMLTIFESLIWTISLSPDCLSF